MLVIVDRSKVSHLVLNVGYSHQVTIPAPEGINLAVEANTKVTVNGIDKQLVGQVAANIRASTSTGTL